MSLLIILLPIAAAIFFTKWHVERVEPKLKGTKWSTGDLKHNKALYKKVIYIYVVSSFVVLILLIINTLDLVGL